VDYFRRQRHSAAVWATLASILLFAAPQLFGQGTSVRPFPRRPEPVPDRYIVQLRTEVEPVSQAERLARQHGLSIGVVYRDALKGFSAIIPPGRLAQLRNDPAVLTIEPDLIVRAVAQTVPTGIERIGTKLNSVAGIDGNDSRVNVDVAVIDTGIDYTHPDLNVFARTDCVDYDLFVILLGLPATCYDGQGTDEKQSRNPTSPVRSGRWITASVSSVSRPALDCGLFAHWMPMAADTFPGWSLELTTSPGMPLKLRSRI
jgi:hypothetical protein